MNRILALALTLALICCGCTGMPGGTASGKESSQAASSAREIVLKADSAWTTVTPPASEEAFANPMKGFRGQRYMLGGDPAYSPYITTIREYVPWSSIEKNASSTAADIVAYTNEHFGDLAAKNVRLIPRVYLEWPSSDKKNNRRYWPDDLQEGDYWSDEFNARAVNLIRKMAEAWDNDPRIAGVEMGIYGYWGEHHLYGNPEGKPTSIPAETQKLLGDAFSRYFKNKKVMIRYPRTFADYDFGCHLDSFGLGNAKDDATNLLRFRPDAWKTQMIGGEVAYDWGDYRTTVGDGPTDTVSDPAHWKYLIDWIRTLHTSSLGWVASYNAVKPETAEGAAQMQKVFGYRYIVESFSYTAKVTKDLSFACEITLRNDGSAPFYYDWPLTLNLLDPDTLEPVYKQAFDFDLRTLLPGDQYDADTHAYTVAPEPKTAKLNVTLPESLKGKGYLAAISIDDPSCGKPAVRLACSNYLNGGYHPMGTVDFGGSAEMPSRFDKIADDTTLNYVKE